MIEGGGGGVGGAGGGGWGGGVTCDLKNECHGYLDGILLWTGDGNSHSNSGRNLLMTVGTRHPVDS